MKYLVMECHTGYAVLMDEDTRFVRAANLHYTVGQTVTDPILMKEPEQSRPVIRKTVIRIAAAAACLLLLSTIAFAMYRKNKQQQPETRSVVVMVEQTRYEMGVNSSGEVISLQKEDGEGKQTVDSYDGQHLSPAELIRSILTETMEQGSVSENSTVQVYLSSDDQNLYSEYKEQIEQEAAKLQLNADVKGIAPADAAPKPPAPKEPHEGDAPLKPVPPADDNKPVPPSPPDAPAPDADKTEPPKSQKNDNVPHTAPTPPEKPPVHEPDPKPPAEPVTPPDGNPAPKPDEPPQAEPLPLLPAPPQPEHIPEPAEQPEHTPEGTELPEPSAELPVLPPELSEQPEQPMEPVELPEH